MASGKYETVDRKFLDTFYRECGREVTLAYTVLNQTNTWAITFFAAVLGSSFVGLVQKDAASGQYTFDYPNPYHWLYLILAWGLLLRFMQRSALALSNMYRWNELAAATWEVVALPADHPRQPALNDALVERVNRLLMNWREPRSPAYVLWGTMELLYFFPAVILLGLIIWGWVTLPANLLYDIGWAGWLIWTAVEAHFYLNWNTGGDKALRGPDADRFLDIFRRRSEQTEDEGPIGQA